MKICFSVYVYKSVKMYIVYINFVHYIGFYSHKNMQLFNQIQAITHFYFSFNCNAFSFIYLKLNIYKYII